MKTNRYILILTYVLLSCAMVSCDNLGKDEYQITGKIDNLNQGVVYLSYTFNYKEFVDSAIVKNQRFQLRGKLPEPLICTLKVKGNNQQVSFFVEPGKFELQANPKQLFNTVLTGSEQNDVYQDFKKNGYKNVSPRKYPSDTAFVNALDRAAVSFVMNNTQRIATAAIINEKYVEGNDYDKAEELYPKLSKEVQKSYYGMQILYYLESKNRVAVGNPAPDLMLPDSTGKLFSLSQFKGQYVLIDFWASYCAPCRKEFPNIIKAYSKYHSKGFEVVGISIDVVRKNWIYVMNSEHLPWINLYGSNAKEGRVSAVYGVRAVPVNFLLDKNGVIIASNLHGDQLEKHLDEIFKQK
jgi:peroxiredoxin